MKKKETVLSILRDVRELLRLSVIVVETKPMKSSDRFIKLQDGWVKDKHTGLEWGPSSSKEMSWEVSKKHCSDLGGRLPTVRELEFLVDRTEYNPAIDKAAFTDTKTDDYYWTCEEVAGLPGSAWIVFFNRGSVDNYHKGYVSYVRPVRSSQ